MAGWRKSALLIWCLVFAAFWLVVPSPVASEPGAPHDKTVAIPVRETGATFDLPATSPRDQYLLVVSSLSQLPGPFPVHVTTEPVVNPQPLRGDHATADPHWAARVEQCRKHLNSNRRVVEPASVNPRVAPAAQRTFWIMVRGDDSALAENYRAVRGRLASLGEHCTVYVDEDTDSNRLTELVREVRETFDRAVYPTARRVLGRHRDIDGDGRFAILLTPWLGKLSGGTVSLGGFVRGSDFYSDVEPPLGNRCDMMYLNSELRPGSHVRTLIAHEYAHAVTLNEHVFNRYLPDRTGLEEESWLDESIAHLAENLLGDCWSNLDYRISAYLSDPERYRLVVDDYYAAGIWRGHGNRGSTYLFLRWCVDQYGEGILRDLVQTNLTGIENVEVATGRPFADLYRDWSVALFLSHTALATRREEEFRYLNIRADLNGRLLAGPRHECLSLDGDSKRFEVVGTSSKFLIMHSAGRSAARIRIEADRSAQLQVSLRRLPHNLARLELKVSRAEPMGQLANPGTFRVQLQEYNGIPVRLERLAWERSTRGTNRDADHGYCSPVLDSRQIEQLFESTVVPGSGALVTERLDITPAAFSDGPVFLKVMGRDADGRTLSAWCPLHDTVRR